MPSVVRRAVVLAAVVALLVAIPAMAQRIDIVFERMNSEGSPSVAHAAMQDRDGFLWFGTQHGLYRHDGYRFVLLEPQAETYRAEVPVYSLLEVTDKTGVSFLWIGTQRGLGRWNQATLEYEHLWPRASTEGRSSNALGGSEVQALLRDDAGDIWIGTMAGLVRYSNGEFTEYLPNPDVEGTISDIEIRSLAEDASGNLWIATGRGGVNRLGPGREPPFAHFANDPNDPRSLSEDHTRVVFVDSDDQVWVGTIGGGINRLDESRAGFDRFAEDEPQNIRSMFQDSEGALWIGTDTGLTLFDASHNRFSHYEHNDFNPNSISDDRVNCIYEDNSGVIWLGTQRWLSKFDRSNLGAFELLWRDQREETTLSANTIQAFAEEADGTLWIGTYEGLNRLDPATGVYTNFYAAPNNPRGLGNDKIGSLLIDRQGILWIGTYEDGLNRYDPETGHFERIPTAMRKVPSILEDHHGVLWIAMFGGGLMTIDPATEERKRYQHDETREDSLSSDKVISIFEDAAGGMWFGTHSGGLNYFDRETGAFTRYLSNEEQSGTLSSNGIFSIAEHEGDLLVGTFGGGLNVWTREDRAAGQAIFAQDDLPPRSIYGLLVEAEPGDDAVRHVWASTDQGLWRRAGDGQWKNFGGGVDFNFGAYMASERGDLYFGNDAGVTKVTPSRIKINDYKPRIVLTDFLIGNEPQSFDRPLHEIQDFDIDYRDAFVTFEFAALDFLEPNKREYEYRIGAGEDEWVSIGNSRRATFTNLAAKHHTLTVRSRNSDGVLTEEVPLATIRVAPHPLRSNLAYALYGLTLVAGIWWFLQQQSSKREELERVVTERTAALENQNRKLEELNQKFEEASYTDSLTGLRNRRYLLGTIEKDLDLVLRYYTDREHGGKAAPEVRPDFLFLLIDLDGFKEVNDTYGHTAGDRVLEQVCSLMERACRKSDTLIRWGGDEFLIVGRYTDRSAAEDLAGRIREAICEHPFDIGIGRPIRLTSSIGFSCYPFVPSKPNLLNWEQIIGIADQALYLVKEAGRNSWAGVFSTEKSHLAPGTYFTTEIHDRFEQLEHEAYIDVRRPQAKPKASAQVGG